MDLEGKGKEGGKMVTKALATGRFEWREIGQWR